MRYYEFMAEGRGIAARAPGEVFSKSEIDYITLKGVIYLPAKSPAFESNEQLMQALDQWQSEFDGTLQMFGQKNAATKAAMISLWEDAKGNDIAFGKYLQKVNPGMLGGNWSNTDFSKATGYKSQSVATATQQIPVKPSDLVPADKIDSADVLELLRKNLAGADVPPEVKTQMIAMITNAISGKKTPVPGAAEYARLHEVYTAEFAAPLVYIHGSPILSGDLKIVDKMLADIGVSRAEFNKVLWPDNPTERLVDSYIYAGDVRLGISSKAKKGYGAAASIDGVFNVIARNKSKIPEDFLKKWEDVLSVLTLIMKNNSTVGILKAAQKFDMITLEQAKEVVARMESFDNDLATLSKENLQLLEKTAKRYKPNTTHQNYNVGYHLLAAIARLVADQMRSMDIDTFFKKVLSYADMIQIYAQVSKRGDGAYFNDFIVKYPPEFDGTIDIDPDTNYFATAKPKGKITFKLKKG